MEMYDQLGGMQVIFLNSYEQVFTRTSFPLHRSEVQCCNQFAHPQLQNEVG